MRPVELRTLSRRTPFVPIRIRLTDGSFYDVKHPEMALITRSTVEIGIEEKEGSGIADQVIYCSLVHIVKVEILNSHPAPNG